MSEILKLYRNAQRPYEKFIRYCATAPVGILPYYDGLLDQYSEAEQIFVKRVLELEAKYSALTARIAELEALIEKLVDEGCVIAERFSVKGGSEADLEDWENVIDEYKAVMPEVQE